MSNEREARYAEVAIRGAWESAADERAEMPTSERHAALTRQIWEQLARPQIEAAARAVMAVADEEIAAALREAAAEFASRTQEAAGQVREHWRGQDFVDGEDTAYESAAEWLEARAAREARP